MKYQHSDILNQAISYIGLGTVKLGRDQAVKYPHGFTIPDDKQALDLIMCAKDLGINVIDTAPAYGQSEQRLGKLLRGQRQDWLIVSKAGEEFNDGQSQFDFSRAHITHSVKRSLARLHTDYIDMLLIHSNGDDEKIIRQDAVFETLKDLKQQGLIRSYGMSVKTVAGGELTLVEADAVMVTLNPFDTSCDVILQKAKALNKIVLIKKAFASGHAYIGDAKLSAGDVFKFMRGYPAISSIIVGTINPVHLQQNVAAIKNEE